MAALTPGELAALSTAITRSVITSFQNPDPMLNWGKDFVRKQVLNSESEKVFWLLDWAKLSERLSFYDDTARKDIKAQYMDVKMRHFSDAVQIPSLEANLDTQKAGWLQKAKDIGTTFVKHLTEMIIEYVKDGTTNLTWDGKYYFDGDHPTGYGSGVYDNLLAGDISQTTLIAAKVAMSRFQNNLGEEMGLIPNKLLITVNDEAKARILLNSTYIPYSSVGEVNPVQNIVQDMIVEARNISTGDTNYDDWYVFCTNFTEKPFIHLGLKGYDTPMITNNMALINQSQWNKIYEWKAEISEAIACTFPFLGIKTVGA